MQVLDFKKIVRQVFLFCNCVGGTLIKFPTNPKRIAPTQNFALIAVKRTTKPRTCWECREERKFRLCVARPFLPPNLEWLTSFSSPNSQAN